MKKLLNTIVDSIRDFFCRIDDKNIITFLIVLLVISSINSVFLLIENDRLRTENFIAHSKNEKCIKQRDTQKDRIIILQDKLLDKDNYEIYTSYQKHIFDEYAKKVKFNKRENELKKIQHFVNALSDVRWDQKYIRIISGAFYDAAKKFDLDYRELIAVAWHENRFHPTRRSYAGARGVMQIMEFWVKNEEFRKQTGIEFVGDLDIPTFNIHAGAYVYKYYLDYWHRLGYRDKNYIRKLALLSYNRGSTTVLRLLRDGKDPENGYFQVIQKKHSKISNLEKTLNY